ncbi:Uncharacterised protein [Mycobacterium tuberculosis]|nr:Uncharacterised protein [Mycobacterium tuberculosis]CKV30808.1 Uncharacterised protein [Mycobacterium tuberculosis]
MIGCDRKVVTRECSSQVSHSRAPGGRPSPVTGSTRSASVTGPPSTNRTGMNMFSVMCSAMWTLNIAEP